MRGHRRIIGRFPDGDEVVGSECPIPVLQGDPCGSRHLLDVVYGLGEILDVADALVREVYKHDIGWHVPSPVPRQLIAKFTMVTGARCGPSRGPLTAFGASCARP